MRFNSFLMGGFECSTHRDHRGRRLDLVASTRHDEFAEQDYARLLELGMSTCRDGVRWHLIETEPYRYDFSSLEKQIAAAKKTGMQVIWDYFHYGYPEDIDIFSNVFPERFASFAGALTRYLVAELGTPLYACPVNEISFFSWIGGQVGHFYPGAKHRGDDLKRQLVRAAISGTHAIKSVCPSAKIMLPDPAIHVVSNSDSRERRREAENYRLAQFEGFDMVLGRSRPELGGSEHLVDAIGLNYYYHNQWYYPNRRKIAAGHPQYRPLNEIPAEYRDRYDKPILIAETGIEDDERPEWFRYVAEQAVIARDNGVDLRGICLYPICNHPGWVDDRHCHNGLWDYADEKGEREIFSPLAEEIRRHHPNFLDKAAATA
jgi:beta-glucosidase/6-phospho-beta-glucosidase/beta-galactosidase